ncbi:hypothetical protein RhoFasB10_03298 [Rhodococcus sp. B10]|nr:hypothetical protein [Rhodococcus sp. B10]
MRRPSYDVDEIIMCAEAGLSAAEIIEQLGLKVGERAVQRAVRRYVGPRPKRAYSTRDDPLRRRVVAWMEANGLDRRYCFQCNRVYVRPLYIRQLKHDDDLGTLAFVCHRCKRAGDL